MFVVSLLCRWRSKLPAQQIQISRYPFIERTTTTHCYRSVGQREIVCLIAKLELANEDAIESRRSALHAEISTRLPTAVNKLNKWQPFTESIEALLLSAGDKQPVRFWPPEIWIHWNRRIGKYSKLNLVFPFESPERTSQQCKQISSHPSRHPQVGAKVHRCQRNS